MKMKIKTKLTGKYIKNNSLFIAFLRSFKNIIRPLLPAVRVITSLLIKWLKPQLSVIKQKFKLIINRLGKRRIRWIGFGFGGLLIIVLAFGSVVYIRGLIAASYRLPVAEQALIGQPDINLLSQFSYDAKAKAFYLSKSAISPTKPSIPGVPASANSITIGGSSQNDAKFSLELPIKASQGITTYDNGSGLSFTMVPLFSTFSGKQISNHFVYPLGLSGTKAVYTIKANGIQEDIIYSNAPKSSVKLRYKLKLPNTLQARMMPGGNLGIYSASSYLFGNITFGTPADEQKVLEARQKSPKENLVFVLPAPQIITADGELLTNNNRHIKLTLSGNIVTVIASGLGDLHGPISIDPSVVVASASNFLTGGNSEGDITFDSTNNQIIEAGLTGGSIGSWNSTTPFTGGSTMPARRNFSTVAYNGFLYVMGGYADSSTGDCTTTTNYLCDGVFYDAINSNGTIGSTWNATTVFPSATMPARYGFGAVAYNGYLYVLGGNDNGITTGSTDCSTTTYMCDGVFYALICTSSNNAVGGCTGTPGTIGTWTATTVFPSATMPARYDLDAVAYSGYLYALGGIAGTSSADCTATVDFCKGVFYDSFNANGTIGSTWTATTAFTTTTMPARAVFGAVAYNGYLYVIGGNTYTDSGDCTLEAYGESYYACDGVYYDTISSTGALGTSWTATTPLNDFYNTEQDSNWYAAGYVVYDGYLYVLGGDSGEGNGYCVNNYQWCQEVDYDSINANGTIGPEWNTTTMFTGGSTMPGRDQLGAIAYNGYLYVVGGVDGGSAAGDCPGSSGGYMCNGVFYAPLKGAGGLDSSFTDMATYGDYMYYAADNLAAVAYNNYLYVLGGNANGTYESYVQYVAWDSNTDGGYSEVSSCPGGLASGSIWCQATSFTTARQSLSAIAYNGYMYVIGGQAASSTGGCTATGDNCNDVEYDSINANGSLGSTWTDDTSLSGGAFTNARSNLAAVVYNGYLYIMGGGANNSTSYTSGSGNWTAPTGVSQVYVQAWGGGGGGGFGTNAVGGGSGGGGGEYAAEPALAVTAGNNYAYSVGTAGAGATTSGGTGTAGGNSTFAGNSVTVTAHGGSGGNTTNLSAGGSGSGNTVHYNGGTAGSGGTNTGGASWFSGGGGGSGGYSHAGNAGGSSTTSASGAGATAVSGGGPGGAGQTNAVGSAPASGPGGGGGGGGIHTGGAGWAGQIVLNWTANYYNDVQYAALGSNGSLSEPSSCPGGLASGNSIWCEATAFTTARQGFNAFEYNGYLYILGGQAGSSSGGCTATGDYCNDIQYDSINTNGSLGSTWTDDTSLSGGAFTTSREFFAAAAYNGNVYILNGTDNGTMISSSDEYATLNSNGSLSEPSGCSTLASGNSIWCATNPVNSQVSSNFAALAYEGYIYLFGGLSSASNYQADAYFVTIDNGGPGTVSSAWTATTSFTGGSTMPARIGFSSVAYNGKLYVIGGQASTSTGDCTATGDFCNGVFYDSFNANGTLGSTWTADTTLSTGAFTNARSNFSAVVNNGYLYIIGGGQLVTTTYTSGSGNYTVPTGVSTVQASVWGGGGGGGYGQAGDAGGGGGGGEYASEPALAVTAGNSYAYSVGTAGAGATVSGGTGTAGGNSTFAGNSVTVTAHGGSGGLSSDSGGSGGSGSTNTIHYNGGTGGAGQYSSSLYYGGGGGGSGGISSAGNTGGTSSSGSSPGATAVLDGGPGGKGNEMAGGSAPVSGPGGGGGGGGDQTGGAGYAGKIMITSIVDYNDIQYAALGSNGSLSEPSSCPGGLASGNSIWCEATAFTTARLGLSAQAYDGYLYIIGGEAASSSGGCTATADYCNDVQYDSFNANGSLGSTWTDDTSLSGGAFTTPRDFFSSVAYDGYLYVIGGNNNGIYENDVQYAALNGNGSLAEPSSCMILASGNSIWCEGPFLNIARDSLNAIAYNGYIYVMGGQANASSLNCTTSTYLCNDIWYAAINSNGDIGTWSSTNQFTATTMPARDFFNAIAYNGYIYIMGGSTDTSAGDCTATSDYCSGVFENYLLSIPRIGFYSRLIDFTGTSGDDPNPIEILTNGGDCSSGACSTNYTNPGTGGISGPGGIFINYEFASNACTIFNSSTTLPTGINLIGVKYPLVFTTDGCSNTTNLGRYMWVSYKLDDSQTASFPDATSNHTSITSFMVYYHPASNYRLRGGATFSNGSLQTLDAPP